MRYYTDIRFYILLNHIHASHGQKGRRTAVHTVRRPLVRRLKDIAEYKGHYEDPVLRTLCIT